MQTHFIPPWNVERLGINSLVKDNASPHNNNAIRDSHRRHHVNIVGYHATAEKQQIVSLIRQQTTHYRREQDKKAQFIKQTHELDRLPA